MRKKTHAEFVAQARAIHGSKYSYKRNTYKGDSTKIPIRCSIEGHGIFWQTPGSHLGGCGRQAFHWYP